jgi:hypothetical protein
VEVIYVAAYKKQRRYISLTCIRVHISSVEQPLEGHKCAVFTTVGANLRLLAILTWFGGPRCNCRSGQTVRKRATAQTTSLRSVERPGRAFVFINEATKAHRKPGFASRRNLAGGKHSLSKDDRLPTAQSRPWSSSFPTHPA